MRTAGRQERQVAWASKRMETWRGTHEAKGERPWAWDGGLVSVREATRLTLARQEVGWPFPTGTDLSPLRQRLDRATKDAAHYIATHADVLVPRLGIVAAALRADLGQPAGPALTSACFLLCDPVPTIYAHAAEVLAAGNRGAFAVWHDAARGMQEVLSGVVLGAGMLDAEGAAWFFPAEGMVARLLPLLHRRALVSSSELARARLAHQTLQRDPTGAETLDQERLRLRAEVDGFPIGAARLSSAERGAWLLAGVEMGLTLSRQLYPLVTRQASG